MSKKLLHSAPFFLLVFIFSSLSVSAQGLRTQNSVPGGSPNSLNNNGKMIQQQNMQENTLNKVVSETVLDSSPSGIASPSPSLRRRNLQNKIKNISDENKREAMSRLDARLAEKNTRLVSVMTNHLDRVDLILARIEDNLENLPASSEGDAISSLILEAKNYIDLAEKALLAQGKKEYVVDFKDKTNLKMTASETVKQFRDDITLVRDAVKTAHDSVVEVVKSYSMLDKSGTDSGTESAVMN